ncbi:unnamed protein product [Allacma fusca]|uniref:Carboxylic ester hydrolase n=1 Tax=Allacma fusca TaxID=39272 RepID=A0A8J2J254_9HEXA|nr:unnamed protein product [Allacma fusca]
MYRRTIITEDRMKAFSALFLLILLARLSAQTIDDTIDLLRNPLCQFLSATAQIRIPACSLDLSTSVVVETKSGQLRGNLRHSRNGARYNAYLGIRYAEEPERFQIAKPAKPWSGIKDADRYGSSCPQITLLKVVMGHEDCLFLNVFQPTEERCTEFLKLPVLFHIHGGAFKQGSGKDYGPKYLMDECIVYVSINYRLGALERHYLCIVQCFLTTDDGVIPGNLGLKDTLLALKWTRENIEHFRGDPDSITINGISAGGASVSHFLASPAAKGLFHRAIAQSGSSLNDWAVVYDPKTRARRLAEQLGCNNTEISSELKNCLLSMDLKAIVREQDSITRWIFDDVTFGPVIEPADSEDPFQTEHPYVRLKRGDVNRVPLITGNTKDEGILFHAIEIKSNNAAQKDINNNWHEMAPLILQYDYLNVSKEVRNRISDQIRAFYFQNRTLNQAGIESLINLESDRNFNAGTYEEALLYSKYAPVYHYAMTFTGAFSLTTLLLGLPYIAVSHGHDAQFLFKTSFFVPEPRGDSLKFSKKLIKLWVSFMQSGVPTQNATEDVTWEQFSEDKQNTHVLDLPSMNSPINEYSKIRNLIEQMQTFANEGVRSKRSE